jgi:hypothetical protein
MYWSKRVHIFSICPSISIRASLRVWSFALIPLFFFFLLLTFWPRNKVGYASKQEKMLLRREYTTGSLGSILYSPPLHSSSLYSTATSRCSQFFRRWVLQGDYSISFYIPISYIVDRHNNIQYNDWLCPSPLTLPLVAFPMWFFGWRPSSKKN